LHKNGAVSDVDNLGVLIQPRFYSQNLWSKEQNDKDKCDCARQSELLPPCIKYDKFNSILYILFSYKKLSKR